ncbi:MAG: tetratricopeptide repeat protein [Chromatiaceae bacterium]|nr:tetratricopeptide repeat protein [Gammaproteobacteria bacterium]MCP5304120.1 tetratricopeptide repeat protein [Chromatiaceae bacterium]MCP5313846.1 tetratricopeptide repeat protein [Chromatiaceae bacterium]
MRRLIFLLSGCLYLVLTGAGPALAQSAATLDEGERLAAAGDVQGALGVYETLVKEQPDSHQAFNRLGGMQLASQHYADAVKSFQQAVMLGDPSAGAFIGMGMGYLHMGEYGPARAAFVEAKARGVQNPAEVDSVIEWIDSREPGMLGMHQ